MKRAYNICKQHIPLMLITHLHYNLKLKDDSVKRVQLLHISADFMFLTCHNPGCTRATTKTQICIQVLFKKLFILNKRGGEETLHKLWHVGEEWFTQCCLVQSKTKANQNPEWCLRGKRHTTTEL